MSFTRSLGRMTVINTAAVNVVGPTRGFSAGAGRAKKGSKGVQSVAPEASVLGKEMKSSSVFGASILKDMGADPKILSDSEYPDWLWHLLDKRPPLSELRRKNIETLCYEDLRRFVKLDNCARINENNSAKANN